MSEHEEYVETDPGHSLLGPRSCAIAGFTLCVLTLSGHGSWTYLATVLQGASVALGQQYLNGVAFVSILVSILGIVLSGRAVSRAGQDAWAAHLGRAAILLGGLAILIALLGILASSTTQF
jgi:hypothetical protein